MTGVGAALNTARVEPGSVVAVLGCGGVGQFVIQGARIAGAARIIAVDPVATKRDKARANGATDVIDPTATDPVEAVRELTAGRGADYAFEVAMSGPTLNQAYDLCRNAGTVIAVGMPPAGTKVEFDGFQLFSTEKRLLGCYYGSGQVRQGLSPPGGAGRGRSPRPGRCRHPPDHPRPGQRGLRADGRW